MIALMFSTSNNFTILLPDNTVINFGPDSTAENWVGLVGESGVTSSVDLRESRENIARQDGEIIGQSYWGNRSIVADIFIPDGNPETRGDKIKELQKVTTTIRDNGYITWTESDTEAETKQVPVRLQSFPTLTHSGSVVKTYQIAFTATQPHIESAEVFNLDDEGAAIETEHTITNAGDWTTYPVIKITGPITAGIIENQTTGESMTLSGLTTTVDDWIEIYNRPDQRQVLQKDLTTTTNIFNKLTIGSNFISLAPGANVIELKDVAGDTGDTKLFIEWRSAWL
jgi:hypothetical protein